MTAPRQPRRSSAGGDKNTRRMLTGVARDDATEGGLRRGLSLRGAGGVAHPLVVATGAGVAGADGGELFCGRRSSGKCGRVVPVHVEAI